MGGSFVTWGRKFIVEQNAELFGAATIRKGKRVSLKFLRNIKRPSANKARKAKKGRTQFVFVLVPFGADKDVNRHDEICVVMPDYFPAPLFGPRQDAKLDDDSARILGHKVWRELVLVSDRNRPNISVWEQINEITIRCRMPLGISAFRPVILQLAPTDHARTTLLLQPLRTHHVAGPVILTMLTHQLSRIAAE